MLTSLAGTALILVLLGANPTTAPVSTPVFTLKNCSHIEFRTQVVITERGNSFQAKVTTSNESVYFIGYVLFGNGLNLGIAKGNAFQQETQLSLSKSTLSTVSEPFNVTVLFQFPVNPNTYRFNVSIAEEEGIVPEKTTENYGKSRCDPGNNSSIRCENACLCDTPISLQCSNGTIAGQCSDPGTLFQSPGNLTFDGICPPEPKGGLTPGQIAGIVIGVLIFIIIVGAAIYCLVFKKK